ncbi:hypothetical protein [Bifidobacterium sp.]|uniref:hypothetical protein n=1 Tax=Bifidobacterium sp. TaxID=41200 RepID=UPI0025BBB7DA|nr:hypothetical protein [Bifidobacterium sp.]MCI1635493.1 hypothetical protein [Bifidobacterium sp.]
MSVAVPTAAKQQVKYNILFSPNQSGFTFRRVIVKTNPTSISDAIMICVSLLILNRIIKSFASKRNIVWMGLASSNPLLCAYISGFGVKAKTFCHHITITLEITIVEERKNAALRACELNNN